jgi:DNA-nicking Smr family endonuclease
MSESDDDFDLFRSSVGAVRRIRTDRDLSRPEPPAPKPNQRELDEARVMDDLAHAPIDFSSVETGEEISYLRPGLQKRVLTRLRRGHWRIEDELDLHHMNLEAATNSIRRFLADADRDRMSCVRIIHGKGLRSGPEGPQLKRLTARLLSRHGRVAAFASAPPHDGGTGAVYVLMRARR